MHISSYCKFLGYIFAFSVMVFPRAYGLEKLFLLLVLLTISILAASSKRIALIARPLKFFLVYAAIFTFALVVGVFRGNSIEALLDGFRLGIVFPLLIAVLWMLLSQYNYSKFVNSVVVVSALSISLLVFVAFAQNIFGLQILPESFAEENLFRVGIHDGYSQVVAHNIGSLFFIYGYLLYSIVSSERQNIRSLNTIALLFVVFAAMISGRRALQFSMLASPIFIFFNAKVFQDSKYLRIKILKWWAALSILMGIVLFQLFSDGYLDFNSFVERFKGVFEDDGGARTSQASSLLAGFASYPFFGSGVGGTTDVIRSELSPWVYELTYLQLLFNLGIFGFILLLLLFIFEFRRIFLNASKNLDVYSRTDKSMIAGVVFLMFGAASNPYLGSFDFLLMIGSIPFVAAMGLRRIKWRISYE